MFRKTKIVCTIGPSSEDYDVLRRLVKEGMDVARLNFSHGTHEEHIKRVGLIRRAAEDEGKVVSILLDTKGPEIRTGELSEDVELLEGSFIVLTHETILGSKDKISISYKDLHNDIREGDSILIDDGLIELKVVSISGKDIKCKVINTGLLKSRKGVNLPGIEVNLPGLTDKDKLDIKFAIDNKLDFIAASFVRKAQDVLDIRYILDENASNIHIVSKIENREGINNLNEILEVSDGIMVARGDLGIEVPVEEVPILQKEIIYKCNMLGKPVITATQMLDSMERNPRPTRAESSDVANAIFDGTDALMLSGETAAGLYPVESVVTMHNIALSIESKIPYGDLLRKRARETNVSTTESISQAVVYTSHKLDSTTIVTPTETGNTPRLVSKYRPRAAILALTPHKETLRKLTLVWGVCPAICAVAQSTDDMFSIAVSSSINYKFAVEGDLLIITAGVPVGKSGSTNLIKVHVVGGLIAKGQGIGSKVVTGKVVLLDNVDKLEEASLTKSILVAPYISEQTDKYIKRCKGVVIEEEGVSSRAAKVCLDLGIPLILGVREATNLLVEGSVISLNAEYGHIYPGKTNIL